LNQIKAVLITKLNTKVGTNLTKFFNNTNSIAAIYTNVSRPKLFYQNLPRRSHIFQSTYYP